MAKLLDPEILALVPNGIENVVLYCTVCKGELPTNRRAYGHHAGVCHKVVIMHRRYVISLTKCISCLHPSTPQERADFNSWRKSRGDRNQRGGRVKGQKYSKKPLDNPEADLPTPDIALCEIKQA